MTTTKLIEKLNAANGKEYPDVGFVYFADVKGDGRNIKSVYHVRNNIISE